MIVWRWPEGPEWSPLRGLAGRKVVYYLFWQPFLVSQSGLPMYDWQRSLATSFENLFQWQINGRPVLAVPDWHLHFSTAFKIRQSWVGPANCLSGSFHRWYQMACLVRSICTSVLDAWVTNSKVPVWEAWTGRAPSRCVRFHLLFAF